MPDNRISPELWYHQLGTSYVLAQIMFHFNRVGVMAYLADRGPATAREISENLKLDEGKLSSLLHYVANVDQVIAADGEGRFFVSEFGQAVLQRYSRVEKDFKIFNFHEVRVGAYGPVWESIGDLLTREKLYGREVKRRGEFAEDGVYAQALKFRGPLLAAMGRFGIRATVEFGANTGLTEQVADGLPNVELFCLDRSLESLNKARDRFQMRTGGSKSAHWMEVDVFNVASWASKVSAKAPLGIFSIHFHELIAKGPNVLTELMRSVRAEGLHGYVFALEQPRLELAKRGSIPESLWLYSQSNVLIHHFIGNGKILSAEEWVKTFTDSECELLSREPTGFLGYELFSFKF